MTDNSDRLRERLQLLVPINNLEPAQIDQVLRSSEIVEVKKRENVFRQGDRDNWSFYVIDGEIELYADDQLIKRVVGGEAPSFQALAQLQPRQMSAVAKAKSRVLRVDRGLVDRLLSVEPSQGSGAAIEVAELDTSEPNDWLTEMLQSDLFAHVPPSNIQKLLETLESIEYKAGDVVIEQGALGDYYYAIQSGRCEVLRTINNKKSIKLAELKPGDRFGEEALVSNAKRNATVRMVTDGELARLTKSDFVDLIKKPVLSTATLDQARALVEQGAKWLDVRFPEEQAANGLPESLNIPLSNLRVSHHELDKGTIYVAYCDTGGRSSAAAFLLTQEGFEVWFVEGGAIDEVPQGAVKPRAKTPAQDGASSTNNNSAAAYGSSSEEDEVIEADVRAQSLAADLEKAKIQIEQAQRLMAEANAAKEQADRLVAEKLAAEREKINQEAAARMAAADKLVAEKLESERSKLDREAEAVANRLKEAERLKNEIERQQKIAAAEAARRRTEQDEKNATALREAEERLRHEEDRMEELYRKQAEALEELERSREQAESEIENAWREVETEATVSKERLEAAKELEARLLEKERQRELELKAEEERMRAALQAEVVRERKKLEAEFVTMTNQVEAARREREAAQAAKQAAAEEAQRIIDEYKSDLEKVHAEQHARLIAERRQLEVDAARLKTELQRAAASRAEAENLKREAERQLAETRERHREIDAGGVDLHAEIEAIEKRAKSATERLRAALAEEHKAANNIRESEKRLEQTYDTSKELTDLLSKDLDEWVAEQERIQGSTARREEMEKIHAPSRTNQSTGGAGANRKNTPRCNLTRRNRSATRRQQLTVNRFPTHTTRAWQADPAATNSKQMIADRNEGDS